MHGNSDFVTAGTAVVAAVVAVVAAVVAAGYSWE